MAFERVYRALVAKAERKSRSRDEVDRIICWFTGYDRRHLRCQLDKGVDFETFLAEAPCLNPDRQLITGMVCGIRVETVDDPVMREIRRLDKLIDELAKGKAMDRILRGS